MSNPPKNALPLLEAVEKWSDGATVESLCRIGEWRCWARRRTRDGVWVELPAEAWEHSEAWRPDRPVIVVELPELGLAWMQPIDPEALHVVSQDYLVRQKMREVREKQRDGEVKTFERLVVVEEWFEPRFAPVPPPRTSVFRKETDDQIFKNWLVGWQESHNGRIPTRPKCRDALKDRLATRTIDALKCRYAHGGKGGRSRKV